MEEIMLSLSVIHSHPPSFAEGHPGMAALLSLMDRPTWDGGILLGAEVGDAGSRVGEVGTGCDEEGVSSEGAGLGAVGTARGAGRGLGPFTMAWQVWPKLFQPSCICC